MQYQVVVRKPAEAHFTASIVGLTDIVADGKTEQEAIANVKSALTSQLEKAKVFTIEIGVEPEPEKTSPWRKRAGAFADDPTWDEFVEEMEVYRKQVDQEKSS